MNLAYAECPLDIRESLAAQYFVDAIRDEDTQHSTRLMDAKDLKSALAYSTKYEAARTVAKTSRHVRSMEIEDNTGRERDVKFESLFNRLEKLFNCSVARKGNTPHVAQDIVLYHKIRKSDHPPFKQYPRRLPLARKEETKRLVNEMVENGIIEESSGPWASPIVLVKKKDGSTRFCVDYRKLNEIAVNDSYPLPRIDDTLDALNGSQWFTTLDLKSGYWQVEIRPEDREKTAFTTGQGLWSKIEEAVSLVPRMHPEAKLKAVQFWNIVSEKLQDIVNNSAADINAVALKMDETDSSPDKLNMEMNDSASYISPQNSTSTPDFMDVTSGYSVYSESGTQFHNADLSNTELKQLSATEPISSNLEEHPSTNEITSLPHIHHLSAVTDTGNTSKTGNEADHQLLDIANIPSDSENFAQSIPCTSEMSHADVKPNISTVYSQNSQKDVSYIGQHSKSNEQIYNDFDKNASCDNSSGLSNQIDYRRSSSRLKELKKKTDFKDFIGISDDSYGANASDMEQDFDPQVNLEDSNEPDAERIVRCVSNIKKLLETEEDSRPPENNEDVKILKKNKDMHNTDSSESLYTCKVCRKKFPNLESLENHSFYHEKPYSCKDCGQAFASKGNLSVRRVPPSMAGLGSFLTMSSLSTTLMSTFSG
ncbi:Transposon Ty3-G Gag-Pol polyprotein [Araneus ventricosus]|uniref:Transposon Ty3-G Gag-Pol polyprotein n=1 Tax=Araneus ventricosus TaxID=182803 RepID=A0A4Y2S2J8_ARAVE|nr:Transposon Ty3-G Gag-Pol polyprotein [Araneus ventricosus]